MRTIQLEDLLQNPQDEVVLESYDDILSSYSELRVENYEFDVEFTAFECAEEVLLQSVNMEGEKWDKLKAGAKTVLSKLFDLMVKAAKFILKIIAWPFKKLTQLFKRLFGKDGEHTADDQVRSSQVNVKTDAFDMAKDFEESIVTLRDAYGKEVEISEFAMECIQICDEFTKQGKMDEEFSHHTTDRDSKLVEKLQKHSAKVTHYQNWLNSYKPPEPERRQYHAASSTLNDAINHLIASCKHLHANVNDVHKLELSIESLLNELEKMQRKLSAMDYSPDSKEAPLMINLIGAIRTTMVMIATKNVNVGKWVDRMNSRLGDLMKASHIFRKPVFIGNYNIGNNVSDYYMGVPVIVNDPLGLSCGGAACTTFAAIETNEILDVKRLIEHSKSNPSQYTVIIAASWMIELKETDPEVYKAIMGHEIGHEFNATNDQQLLDRAKGREKATYYDHEQSSDIIGHNFSQTKRIIERGLKMSLEHIDKMYRQTNDPNRELRIREIKASFGRRFKALYKIAEKVHVSSV